MSESAATSSPQGPYLQWAFAEIPSHSAQDLPETPENPHLQWAFAESPSHSAQDLPDTWADVGPLPNNLRGMVVYKPSFMQQLFGIGSGGFATVYGGQLAIGERIIKVVIKCMHRSSDDVDIIIDQNRKRFAREIRVARKLVHPNVVRFYGICSGLRITMGEDDPTLIFEYCEGRSIADYLKKNPATSRLPLTIDVAAGLSYMHANGVIHGDLKPNNVFIKISGDTIQAVLGDFGSARILDVDMPSVVRAGHARYDAPEIAFSEDDTVLTKESDVFAFSLTALAIVTGRELLQDEDTEGLHERIATNGERPLRSDFASSEMSDKLWETLERCWNQDPSKRTEISQVLSELQGLASEG